jgi:predicted aminopeptidase
MARQQAKPVNKVAPFRRLAWWLACWLTAGGACALLLGGCAATSYLGQSISGEFELLQSAQPIDALLASNELKPELRARLQTVQKIRDFASRQLMLPDNGSYRSYADIKRPFVVWNVFAAPQLSLRLSEWCFPITGCVGYRGYFSERAARQFGDALRAQGLDVLVAGVPAYSTLGYFDDPVLSSFIQYPENELARLLFHELAHQIAYAPGDTQFNESFAVAVEDEGMHRYLAGSPPALAAAYEKAGARREQFMNLVNTARLRLQTAYAEAGDDAARRIAKMQVIAALRRDYVDIKQREWEGFAGYDAWFATDLNNAKLGSIAVYSAQVPVLQALLQLHHGQLAEFYEDARRLAKLPKAERDAELAALPHMDKAASAQAKVLATAQATGVTASE